MGKQLDKATSLLREASARYGIEKLSVRTIEFWNRHYKDGGVSFCLYHLEFGLITQIAAVGAEDLIPFGRALLTELALLREFKQRRAA